MKKTISFILTMVLIVSLSACGRTAGDRVASNAQDDAQLEPEQTMDTQKKEMEFITRDQAIETALNKAGLTKDEVYELEAELDKEREGVLWEVDFETREYEYSYDIDALTGKIVLTEITPEDKRDNKSEKNTEISNGDETIVPPSEEVVAQPTKEPDREVVTQPTKEPSKEVVTQPSTKGEENTELITRDGAIEIALNKAGLAKDEVYELEAELDKEREGVMWEVDFETREYEYSYEINAQTGAVVHQEKERND